MPHEGTITHDSASQTAGGTGAPEPQLLVLCLLSSALLVLSQSWLAGDAAMTAAAWRVYAVVLALGCGTALIWLATGSMAASALALTAFLASALWIHSPWMLLLPVVAGAGLLVAVGPASVLKLTLSPKLVIGAVVAMGLVLSYSHYADFLILEKLREGEVHQDTAYNASIASMIKTYGVVSTGLHGLVPVYYHVFSHRLFATLSILSGVHVLEIYPIVLTTVLCPLVVMAGAWSAARLSGHGTASTGARMWLVVCGILIVHEALPFEQWDAWGYYFISETYALSLVYLLLALGLLASPQRTLAQTVLGGVLIVLAGLSKVSVGVVGVGMFWAMGLFLPRSVGRGRTLLIAAIATAALVWGAGGWVQDATSRTTISPFFLVQRDSLYGGELRVAISHLRFGTMPPAGIAWKALVAVVSFLAVNFILSWYLIGRRVVISGWRSLLRHEDTLFTLVAVGLGLGSAQFHHAGLWYFINQSLFIALPFAAASIGGFGTSWPARSRRVLAAATLAGAAFILMQGYQDHVGVFKKTRGSLLGTTPVRTAFAGALMRVRDFTPSQPAIFEADSTFPAPDPNYCECNALPFMYPAVTEHAWIGLIVPDSDCRYREYGYQSYLTGNGKTLVPPVIPPGVVRMRVSAAFPPAS